MKPKKALRGNRSGYILSESLDFWMTGGVSIVVMFLLLVYIFFTSVPQSTANITSILGTAIVLQLLINWPHFMGAYRLIYTPKSNIKRYKSATIYIPSVLLLILIVGLVTSEPTEGTVSLFSVNQDVTYFCWLVAAFYLAWHYTGQAWGMIATYSKLSQLTLKKSERLTLRLGLRTLLAWHVIWGAQDLPAEWFGGVLHANIDMLLSLVNIAACLAFFASSMVWYGVYLRTKRIPDKRILVSWLSIYLWYFVLFFMPEAYLLVQASHALQYLPFPMRVELNRRQANLGDIKQFALKAWAIKYYVLLLSAGIVFFYFPEFISIENQQFTFAVLVSSLINIHHYFVDSCIWRISNAEVRHELFAHLETKNVK